MSLDVAIVALITFLGTMFYLEKGNVPNKLKKIPLFKGIPLVLLYLFAMMGLSMFSQLLYFVVIATIMSGCFVNWRFRLFMEGTGVKNV
ncbi:MAG: hypothetical protein LBD38_03800 [Streptococcaceae bacterium]|jgi:hypothetical protein|nr:hypothetical protein [Streptococcaceae bacterium]